jgi:hypothetical protein
MLMDFGGPGDPFVKIPVHCPYLPGAGTLYLPGSVGPSTYMIRIITCSSNLDTEDGDSIFL